MSQILYIASDYPLAKIENPHYKMLSVNEALAIGMENIPEFMLAPEFNHDQPGVLLWSDTEITIDTERNTIDDGGLDDDFSILESDDAAEDIFTQKQYRVYIEWNYSRGRAERIIAYIRNHLEQAGDLELWQAWLGDGANTRIVRYSMRIDELTPEVMKEIDSLPACSKNTYTILLCNHKLLELPFVSVHKTGKQCKAVPTLRKPPISAFGRDGWFRACWDVFQALETQKNSAAARL